MIKISMDEAEAFDRLAILEVKIKRSPKRNARSDPMDTLYFELLESLGDNNFSAILMSQEYEALYQANLSLFNLIDESKNIPMQASVLDIANYKRFKAKKVLQEKFFKTALTEVKIGYDKL